ncbi:hypothetical protein BKP35_01630 [Anaerobacillus arseniciselenatis]|uniref:DUF3906 domain-containing protein n=1 Tax=Anaerobacillus arseniciselenatis TaxID=85682 RepID=A0A1S2LT49_9BACI|nr:DUF3906 family protein [Anaerobacillus arseniciselenatis]OIJ15719.1 hypothetical protein BKP35_01630 [Anaerobacillus arseniciselenatis]
MKLYHFTVLVDSKEIPVVVAAESDEQAFKRAEIEVEKSFLKFPDIKEVVLLERKKVTNSGTAFVITEKL